MHLLGEVGDRTVEELGIGNLEKVVDMLASSKAIHALYLMWYHKVSNIGCRFYYIQTIYIRIAYWSIQEGHCC